MTAKQHFEHLNTFFLCGNIVYWFSVYFSRWIFPMLFSLHSTSGCLSFSVHKHRISTSNSFPYAIPFLQPITPHFQLEYRFFFFSERQAKIWLDASHTSNSWYKPPPKFVHFPTYNGQNVTIISYHHHLLSFPYHQNQLELSPSYIWNQSTSLHLWKNYKLQLSLAWLLQNLLSIHHTCTLCTLPFSPIYGKTWNMKGIKTIRIKRPKYIFSMTLSHTAHCFQWKN